MPQNFVMPEMGEGVIEGTVSRWLKQEGDTVELFEPILEIETDKVTTEATADVDGVLLKILVSEGDTVEVGTPLAVIGEAGESAESVADAPTAVPDPEPAAETPVPQTTAVSTSPPRTERYTGRISPLVGRIAAEHNINLDLVPGTGKEGRITKRDILAYVEDRQSGSNGNNGHQTHPVRPVAKQPAPPPARSAPEPAPAASPAVSSPTPPTANIMPLTSIRRSIAEHMVHSKKTSPHVTTVFEFDFTAVDHHRRAHKAQFKEDGAHLTFTAYLVAATVQALKQHPMVNSQWHDSGIELKREINIGMATAIDDGLVVPVIKQADGMNLLGLARTINDLADRARRKQLQPADMKGGTFTLTNHGVTGSLFATPIINQPQCGILGVGKIEKRVKVIEDAIAIRPLAYVSFTFDHRILDGATADNFVSSIKEAIETWS